MGLWEVIEKSIKEELGLAATPAQLRNAALCYASEALMDEGKVAIEILSRKIRWSWVRLHEAGKEISYKSDLYSAFDKQAALGNAISSLADYYRSAAQAKRLEMKWSKFQHCSLCWRFVPAVQRIKHRALCSYHQPRTGDYRKHLRIEPKARELYKELIRTTVGHPSLTVPATPGEWLLEYYPHTHGYLTTKAGTVDVSSWQSILRVLDDNRDPVGARKKLHSEMLQDKGQLLSFLGWSEAWQKALSGVQWGGRRQGAGRPSRHSK